MAKEQIESVWIWWLNMALRRTDLKPQDPNPDEVLVENARKFLAERRKLRWLNLFLGSVGVGFSICESLLVVRRLALQQSIELGAGFFTGVGLALIWTTCGIMGATFLAKAYSGFRQGTRPQELLVRYHDRLRELGELPGISGEQDDARK